MDGADKIEVTCAPGASNCPPPNPQFMYVNPSQVQPYFQLAEQYTFGDRMFQTNQGPSFPAHQFIISGTSAPTATSNLFASENLGSGTTAGCIAPLGTTVLLVNPVGMESTSQYPCYEHATLTDLLDAKGVSWRYYAPTAGSIWTGPDAIQHICQPQTVNGQLVCTGAAWSNVIIPQTKGLDRHREPSTGRSKLDNSGRRGLRSCRYQRWVGALMGGVDRECNRPKFLLVEHGDHHYLGRLGRMVRSCFTTAGTGELRTVGVRICLRIPGTADRRIALCACGPYLSQPA